MPTAMTRAGRRSGPLARWIATETASAARVPSHASRFPRRRPRAVSRRTTDDQRERGPRGVHHQPGDDVAHQAHPLPERVDRRRQQARARPGSAPPGKRSPGPDPAGAAPRSPTPRCVRGRRALLARHRSSLPGPCRRAASMGRCSPQLSGATGVSMVGAEDPPGSIDPTQGPGPAGRWGRLDQLVVDRRRRARARRAGGALGGPEAPGGPLVVAAVGGRRAGGRVHARDRGERHRRLRPERRRRTGVPGQLGHRAPASAAGARDRRGPVGRRAARAASRPSTCPLPPRTGCRAAA